MLSIRFGLYYPDSIYKKVEAAFPHNLQEFCTDDSPSCPEDFVVTEGIFDHDINTDKGVHSIYARVLSIDDESDTDYPTMAFEPLALAALTTKHNAEVEYLTRIHAGVLKAFGRSADARKVRLEWRAIVTDLDESSSEDTPPSRKAATSAQKQNTRARILETNPPQIVDVPINVPKDQSVGRGRRGRK